MSTVKTTLLLALFGASATFGTAHADPHAAQSQPTSQPASAPTHHNKHGHKHSFADVEKYAKRFESPERAAWAKPKLVVEKLKLKAGEKVADIGAGTGYFSVLFAHAVAPGGTVYAADLEPGMLKYMDARAGREKITNLVTVKAEPSDPKLPEAVDLIFFSDTWHHIGERVEYLATLKKRLKHHGRIVIVDFKADADLPFGGPPKKMRLSTADVIAEFKAAGFSLHERFDVLSYQYFLTFHVAE